MKKNFWFKDLWVGNIHYFETLDEARESASGECGICNVTIYDSEGNSVETVKTGNPYP
jgi:hypothetical protein